MKALALTKVARLEIIDVPMPQIKNDTDVLLKVSTVGVCGSDIHYYETGHVGSQVVSFPYRVGHECSATVAQVGKGVKNLKLGDLVVVEAAVVCHNCDQCKLGRENTCRNIKFLGTPGQFDGCICEYMVIPSENCLPVTGKLTPIQAAMCEPFTIGLYAAKQGQAANCQTIAILGSGPIGLSCMESARLKDAKKIFMTDKLDYRLNIAAKHGAFWMGNPDKTDIVKDILKLHSTGVDVVYECAGQQSTIDQAAEILRPGGKLILVGIPREDRISFPIDKFRRKELTIINIRRQNRTTEESIKILESAQVNIDYMVSHRFAFVDGAKAFDLVAGYKDNVIKAMIEF
ncbi:MAG: alcohol dehydrogenase catalytic domain-containing protein [Phycisphaerae bacterium]|jgi:L-iditol 2-dehydrogenase